MNKPLNFYINLTSICNICCYWY